MLVKLKKRYYISQGMYRQTAWHRVYFEKFKIILLAKKHPAFMESSDSFTLSKISTLVPILSQLNAVPILSQLNAVHSFIPCSFKIHFYGFLSTEHNYHKLSLLFRFLYQNCVYISYISHACNMPYQLRSLSFITPTIPGQQYKLYQGI
jgi:hypothetical protein